MTSGMAASSLCILMNCWPPRSCIRREVLREAFLTDGIEEAVFEAATTELGLAPMGELLTTHRGARLGAVGRFERNWCLEAWELSPRVAEISTRTLDQALVSKTEDIFARL